MHCWNPIFSAVPPTSRTLEKLKSTSKAIDHFAAPLTNSTSVKTGERVDNRPRIYFTGHVSDDELSSIYSLADAFIMLPIEERGLIEGFGIAYLEAGLYSLPVIGSKIGGVPEAIVGLYDENSDEATGLLVENSQNPKEIAKKILMLIKDEGLAKKLGANGKVWAEKFSWANVARKLSRECRAVRKSYFAWKSATRSPGLRHCPDASLFRA